MTCITKIVPRFFEGDDEEYYSGEKFLNRVTGISYYYGRIRTYIFYYNYNKRTLLLLSKMGEFIFARKVSFAKRNYIAISVGYSQDF